MTTHYVFAGDPMCSWCYGFASELRKALQDLPGVRLQIRVAGLWAGGREPLDDESKTFRLRHWARVEAAAGVVFNRDALKARKNFIYDTEPISRAFVAGRLLAPDGDELSLFQALQRAFYVDGLDTTDESVLQTTLERALADQGRADAVPHAGEVLRSPSTRAATRSEFNLVRDWGLRSFPQLLAVRGDQLTVLCNGFAPAAEIRQALQRSAWRD